MPRAVVKRIDFRLGAVVGGTAYPVTSFRASYPLNGIPTAQCNIAVGLRVGSKKGAPVPASAKPAPDGSVEVYATDYQGQRKKVFSGDVNGVSFQKNNSVVGFSATLVHWLDRLRRASAESSLFWAGIPVGSFRPPARTALSGIDATWDQAAAQYISEVKKSVFFGFTRMLLDAAKSPILKADAAALLTGLPVSSLREGNQDVATTLPRILEPKPLSLAVAGYDYILAQAITVGSYAFGGVGGSSAWDRLLSVAQAFSFAIAPSVDDAVAVPFTPALNVPFKTLTGGDYTDVATSMSRAVNYRGALVYGSQTTVTKDSTRELHKVKVGAWIQEGRPGVIVTAPAPPWLTRAVASSEQKATVSDGVASGGEWHSAGGAGINEKAEKASLDVATRYAKSIWAGAVLAGRSGRLVCPFRTDVAPGSIVAFEVPLDGSKHVFHGAVAQVDLVADATAGNAYTLLHLVAVRSENEKAVVTEHPFYGIAYSGRELS